MADGNSTRRIASSFLAAIAIVSLVMAAFDVWVGTKGKKSAAWTFVVLAILGAVGLAAAIFRSTQVPKDIALAVLPALVSALYFYVGVSAEKTPEWAFTTLTVVGFVKGLSALAALVFALVYSK